MQLRQYQEGHIIWFYTKNNSLTIIGGHLGFWQLWWYVIFFKIFHPFCHPQKHMYRGKFCISLIIRSWDRKISNFFWVVVVVVGGWGGGVGWGGVGGGGWGGGWVGGGVGGWGGGGGGWGAVPWIFIRGNFSSYICLSLKKRFVCPLYLNAVI